MHEERPEGRRRRTAIGVGWLLLFGLGAAWPSSAAVYTSGCGQTTACTFQELLAGGTLTAGGQRFASFEIEDDPGTIDWNQVVVTGRDDSGFSPGPGLRFSHNGEALTNGTDCVDLQFSYTVTPVIPSWQPVGNDMVMVDGTVVGTGRIEVDETLFDATRRAIGDKTIRTDDAFGMTRVFDRIQFPPQAGGLLVSNTITVEGDQAGDQADLEDYVQRFALTSVPEPGLSSLAASGTGLLAWLGRRRRSGRRIPVAHQSRVHHPEVETLEIERVRAGDTNR